MKKIVACFIMTAFIVLQSDYVFSQNDGLCNLEVKSLPDTAQIYVDDKYIADTPYTLPLPKKEQHILRLEKKFYNDVVKKIKPKKDSESVLIKLKEKNIMEINSVPSNAKVFISGNFMGYTPLKLDIADGNYNLKLICTGCHTYSDNILKTSKEKQVLNFTLFKNQIAQDEYKSAVSYKNEKNYKMALSLFEKAAERGHPEAQYNLAMMYAEGNSVEKSRIFSLLEAASREYEANAMFELAKIYYSGSFSSIGIEPDYKKAFELCRKSAEQGHMKAKLLLAEFYQKGIGTEINKNKAYELYKECADAGNAEAQYKIALLYSSLEICIDDDEQKTYAEAIKYFEKSACQDYCDAYLKLAEIYYMGKIAKQDITKANYYSKLAAFYDFNKATAFLSKIDEINAQINLAEIYYFGKFYKGIDIKANRKKAYSIISKYSKSENSGVQLLLSIMYSDGKVVDKNIKSSKTLLNRAINQNNLKAKYRLAGLYYRGEMYEQNIDRAIEMYKELSNEGYFDAITTLAWEYNPYNMKSQRKRNLEKSDTFYKEAAKKKIDERLDFSLHIGKEYYKDKKYQSALRYLFISDKVYNNAEAQYLLGTMFYNGYGIPINYEMAYKYLLKASEQGNAEAQFILGCMYDNGIFVEKDEKKSLEFYEKSAAAGNLKACYNLAVVYYNGENGVEKNYERAFALFNNAAELEYPDTKYQLGMMYLYAEGTDKDYYHAFDLFKTLAETGDKKAEYMVGFMYYLGKGTNANLETAKAWLKKAAAQGYVPAKDLLAVINTKQQGDKK